MNSQVERLNNSSVRGAASRKRRCLFKKDKQSFLFLLEYIFFSVAGPHSDRTVPVRPEGFQRRGDF